MYCHQCGKELREGARFCTACGTAVWKAQEEARSSASGAAALPSRGKGATATPLGSNGTQPLAPVEMARGAQSPIPEETFGSAYSSVSTELPEESAANAAFGQTAEETVSLKGAVGKTQGRSKRPLLSIVLVALALALTSAIAFAAHYVYTTYFAPQQQEQQVDQDELVSTGESAITEESEYVDVWVVDTETSTTISVNGTSTTQTTSSYDESGRLVEQSITSTSSDGSGSTAEQTYAYDGLLPSSVLHQFLTQTYQGETYEYYGAEEVDLTYDGQNRCVSSSDFVVSEGDGGAITDYSYDDSGRIAGMSIVYAYGGIEDPMVESTASIQVTYEEDDTEGESPVFTLLDGEDSDVPSQLGTFSAAQYDEYGNLTSLTYTSSSSGETTTYAYTYKKIAVKRGEWLPNPYSNPTPGFGDLSSYRYFVYYSLTEDRIEQIMTANENENENE